MWDAIVFFFWGFVICFVCLFGFIIVSALIQGGEEAERLKGMTEEQKREDAEARHAKNLELRALGKAPDQLIADHTHGPISFQMVCPHCQTKGKVRTKAITAKKGVSGGKAAAALITSGLSLVVVGLSRKENLTQAKCENCDSTWQF